MSAKYCIIWIIITFLMTVIFWPLGILMGVVAFIVVPITKVHSESRLKAKIDLIAQQCGIQYGTPEDKLDQLAIIVARAQMGEKNEGEP